MFNWIRWKFKALKFAWNEKYDPGGHRFIGRYLDDDYDPKYGGVEFYSKCYRCGQRSIDEPVRCDKRQACISVYSDDPSVLKFHVAGKSAKDAIGNELLPGIRFKFGVMDGVCVDKTVTSIRKGWYEVVCFFREKPANPPPPAKASDTSPIYFERTGIDPNGN